MQLGNLGALLQECGAMDEARACYREAIDIATDVGSRIVRSAFLGCLASLDWEIGRPVDALGLYREATSEKLLVRHQRLSFVLWAEMGAVFSELNRKLEAEEAFGRADPSALLTKLHRAHLDVAEARRARDQTSHAGTIGLAAALTRARNALALPDGTDLNDDRVRFAVRRLSKALGEFDDEVDGTLLLRDGGRAVCLPDGSTVDLATRVAARLVLCALARHRLARPGQSMSAADLVAAGWPGQRIRVHAAESRLYMTVLRLRKLGLRECLLRRDDGYLIDPDLAVVIEGAGDDE